jgi:hypothetical protein
MIISLVNKTQHIKYAFLSVRTKRGENDKELPSGIEKG